MTLTWSELNAESVAQLSYLKAREVVLKCISEAVDRGDTSTQLEVGNWCLATRNPVMLHLQGCGFHCDIKFDTLYLHW